MVQVGPTSFAHWVGVGWQNDCVSAGAGDLGMQ